MISIIKFSVQFFLSENYNLDSVVSRLKKYLGSVQDIPFPASLLYVEGLVLWIDKKGVNLDILFRI